MADTTPARKSGGVYLNHELPSEMMAEIGMHLDLNSKLKLRLALAKSRQGDVTEMLKESLKVLYVSPSRLSIRNFEQICKCNFLRQHVVEVVFLPSVMVKNDESLGRYQSRLTWYHLRTKEWQKSWELYKALTLSEGLSKLSGLMAATVSLGLSRNGVNRSTVFCTDSQNHEMVSKGHYTFRQDNLHRRAAGVIYGEAIKTDVAKFFSALTGSGCNVETMSLGTGPLDPLAFDMQLDFGSKPLMSQVFARQLKKLHICCEDSDFIETADKAGCGVSANWWKQIAEDPTGLQELEICTDLSSYPAQFDYEMGGRKVIDHFLRHGKYPHLREFAIRSMHRAESSAIDSALLGEFLARHSNNLQHVNIADILPSTGKETSLKDVRATFKSLLARMMPAKESLEMRIAYPLEHVDGKCDCEEGEHCNSYRFPGYEIVNKIANKFMVQLNDNSWDFGEVVMRRCRA